MMEPMDTANTAYELPPMPDETESLLRDPVEPEPEEEAPVEVGRIVEATIHETDDDHIYVRLADDQFGRCLLEDATLPGDDTPPQIGDTVTVLVEDAIDDGLWAVSLGKARLIERFAEVEGWARSKRRVAGTVRLVLRGGFAVEVEGLRCFLPGRESGVRQNRAFDLVGETLEFEVTRFDAENAQPVLSRMAFLSEERRAVELERMAELEVGQVIDGVVDSIKPYGAFIDLGGVDALCHVTELSDGHVDDPRDVVRVGETVRVRITDIDTQKGRIGVSRREVLALEQRDRVAAIEAGAVVEGTVTRLADFGAFIAFGDGFEGLCHVSELSWTARPAHPSEVVDVGQTVTVKVITVDADSGRIALSLKAMSDNPWRSLADLAPEGSTIGGTITRIEDYGLFVQIAEGVDGLCHISDMTWEGRPSRPSDVGTFAVGDAITIKVLSIDHDKGRIRLGLKQLTADPWDDAGDRVQVGSIFTAPVVRFDDKAAFLQVAQGLEARLYIAEVSTERVESIRAALRIGQEVEVMTIASDRQRRRLDVSIKAIEAKIEAETPKSFADEGSLNPLAAAIARSGLTEE